MSLASIRQARRLSVSIPQIDTQGMLSMMPCRYAGLVVVMNLGWDAVELASRLHRDAGRLLLIEGQMMNLMEMRRRLIQANLDHACCYALWSDAKPVSVSPRVGRWRSRDPVGYVFIGVSGEGPGAGRVIEGLPQIFPSTRIALVRRDDEQRCAMRAAHAIDVYGSDQSMAVRNVEKKC